MGYLFDGIPWYGIVWCSFTCSCFEDSFIHIFSYYSDKIDIFSSFIYEFFENLYCFLRVRSELPPNIVDFTTKVLGYYLSYCFLRSYCFSLFAENCSKLIFSWFVIEHLPFELWIVNVFFYFLYFCSIIFFWLLQQLYFALASIPQDLWSQRLSILPLLLLCITSLPLHSCRIFYFCKFAISDWGPEYQPLCWVSLEDLL